MAILLATLLIAVAPVVVSAASRYALRGEAKLATTPASDSIGVGRYRVSARLAPAPTKTTHAGNGYTLTASLAARPLVCANDTIFRNGFEQ